MSSSSSQQCWICDSTQLVEVRPSTASNSLSTNDFSITDSNYGRTAAIFACKQCGFRQCSDLSDVIYYYAGLEDEQYEEGRLERGYQARKLLKKIKRYKPTGRLFDIGAGSGILVEQAQSQGYDASGIEPSRWLSSEARKLGLKVDEGSLPDQSLTPDSEESRFDIVTAIDVLEHVPEPVELLKSIREFSRENGICVIVTPDVDSIPARLLGFRWWHYRIAHISYFRKEDIEQAMNKAGLAIIDWSRPRWYFSASYLWVRIMQYLPGRIRIKPPKLLDKITVPLNLFDSWMVIGIKKPNDEALHQHS